MLPKLYISLRVIDGKGKITYDLPKTEGHSWVSNMYSVVWLKINGLIYGSGSTAWTTYSTGNLDATSGESSVTGHGTTWTSQHTGWTLSITGDSNKYTFTYSSPTSGIVSPALKASNMGANYSLLTPNRSSIKDNTGDVLTSSDTYWGHTPLFTSSAGGDDSGIILGTSDTPSHVDDTNVSRIVHGTGSGQLSYQAMESVTQSWDGTNTGLITVTHSRYFNNNSGGIVTVKEMGLFSDITITGNEHRYWCAARDVLPVAANIPDTGQVFASYLITGDVSP
jgi:hypothetical protein